MKHRNDDMDVTKHIKKIALVYSTTRVDTIVAQCVIPKYFEDIDDMDSKRIGSQMMMKVECKHLIELDEIWGVFVAYVNEDDVFVLMTGCGSGGWQERIVALTGDPEIGFLLLFRMWMWMWM